MSDDQCQVEIYHSLGTLFKKNDEDTFKEEMEAFIKLWKSNESKFITNFQNTHASRTSNAVRYVGKNIRYLLYKIGQCVIGSFQMEILIQKCTSKGILKIHMFNMLLMIL